MKRLIVSLALVATIGAGSLVSAQALVPTTPTTGDAQRVTVGNLTYTLDPYNVFMCFPIHGAGDWMGAEGVKSTYTIQCFLRKGATMTPIDAFITDDSGIMDGLDLGTPLGSEVVQ